MIWSKQSLKLITPYVRSFSKTAFRLGTKPEKSLPSPYGENTEVLRRLYDIEMIQWSVNMMKHSRRAEKYARSVGRLSPHNALKKTLTLFYGDIANFFQNYKDIFKVTFNNLVQPAYITDSSKRNIETMMEILVPPWGGMDLNTIAFLSGDLEPTDAYSRFLESDLLQSKFIQSRDEHKALYFYRKCDESVAFGYFAGKNFRTAEALEKALPFVPCIPNYWVPSNLCLTNIAPTQATKVKSLGPRLLQGVMKNAIQVSYYRNDIFVRRDRSNPFWTDYPPCAIKYEEFKLTIPRVLKIAFCLPVEPSDVDKCAQNMFPGVLEWAKTCAYSLWDIIMMYPSLMHINANRKVQSLVRSKFPNIAPEEGKECLETEERAFEVALKENKDQLQSIIAQASEPSSIVFQPQHVYRPTWVRGSPHQAGTPVETVQAFSDAETVSFIAKSMSEHEVLPWVQIRDRISQQSSAIPESDRFWKANQRINLHPTSLQNLIRSHPNAGLHYREERVQGSNHFETYFFRDTREFKRLGNKYLDKIKLLAEVVFQVKFLLEKQKVHEIRLAELTNGMPRDAQEAIRHYGGLIGFLRQHPLRFDLSNFGYVRLKDVRKQ